MEIAAVAGIEQFGQVGGDSAGGGDQRVTRLHALVDDADQLPLTDLLVGAVGKHLGDQQVVPGPFSGGDFGGVAGVGFHLCGSGCGG